MSGSEDGTTLEPPPDVEDVARSPLACGALAGLADALRAVGYDGGAAPSSDGSSGLVALARGVPVPRGALAGGLAAEVLDALIGVALVVAVPGTGDDSVVLRGQILPVRSTMSFLPEDVPDVDADAVYLGPDSVALLGAVWPRCRWGDRAADLGTGNGVLAACLATRFDLVVATDLSARCTAAASLVPAMNPHLAGRIAVVRSDVAGGLRAGAFDVVVANPPWAPEPLAPDGSVRRRFAAGGVTGVDLPGRFIDGAVTLLAPGGRAFVACADLTFADGSRPLRDRLPGLWAQGLDVELLPTSVSLSADVERWAAGGATGLVDAVHVVVIVTRPGP